MDLETFKNELDNVDNDMFKLEYGEEATETTIECKSFNIEINFYFKKDYRETYPRTYLRDAEYDNTFHIIISDGKTIDDDNNEKELTVEQIKYIENIFTELNN